MNECTLKIKNIHLSIAKKTICRDLNLTFHPGEIWGILGPNGCGKTTFLHALASLFPLDEGEILLNDQNLKQFSPNTIATQIGLLFQTTHDTFPQTIWEYCLASRFPYLSHFQKESSLDKQIVFSALEKMELQTILQKPLTSLSGGERRRLSIAALLAQTPQIFLLDEPTNHLDTRYQLRIMQHFQSLAKNRAKTIVMSVHDLNIAQHFCDNILLLFPNGRVLYGKTGVMLNSHNLSSLYQHPMRCISAGQKIFWHPELELFR